MACWNLSLMSTRLVALSRPRTCRSMSSLERAICIAATAHQGQTDKGGAPHVLHPLRVMLAMSNDDERIVAVLHDVIEDTEWTAEALLAEGFTPGVVDAIQ